jgi:aryl-alcohol dehydrogenase-like predicted oxidoreductase
LPTTNGTAQIASKAKAIAGLVPAMKNTAQAWFEKIGRKETGAPGVDDGGKATPQEAQNLAAAAFCALQFGQVHMAHYTLISLQGDFVKSIVVSSRQGSAMDYCLIGKLGIQVSALGFGCAYLGGTVRGISGMRVLEEALDAGINFFDTADSYAQGASEELIGATFHGRRDKVVIATKAGYVFSRGATLGSRIKPLLRPLIRSLPWVRRSLERARVSQRSQDFSPSYLEASIDRSLARLRTDYIDVFLLHSPPSGEVENGEWVEVLENAKAKGKIRAYGVSCPTPEIARICLKHGGIDVLQLKMNLLESDAAAAVAEMARQQGVGVIAREALASGFLAGKGGPLATVDPGMKDSEFEENLRRVGQFGFLAAGGRTLAQAALRYVLDSPGVSVLIAGMLKPAHLKENLAALGVPMLTVAEQERITQLQRLMFGDAPKSRAAGAGR